MAPIISNFLFHSGNDPKEEQKEYVNLKIEIREYLKDKRFRKILAEILFDLQRDVAGATKIRLFHLFKELGLHHDCYKKLESWRWETVAQGIDELTQMQVGEAFQLMQKYINDRRPIVRKQAELAIVILNKEGINYLLDTTSYGISEWQQLKLIEALASIENYQPPNFKGWLLSQNKDVVLFALRLILHYDQNDAQKSIIELVKHKNDEVKKEAISCIRSFHIVEALPTMKSVFFSCTEFVKIQLLNAMVDFAQTGDLEFLEQVLNEESKFSVISKAQAAFDVISPNSVLPTKDILEVSPYEMPDSHHKVPEKQSSVTEVSSQETLEIEEIEVYDIVGSDCTENNIDDSTSVEVGAAEEIVEELDRSFDFSEMDHLMIDALDASLGLIDTEEEATEPIDPDFQSNYLAAGIEERGKILGAIEDTCDSREKGLIEFIVENETDSELRFRAFKCLKQVKNNQHTEEHPPIEIPKAVEEDNNEDLPIVTPFFDSSVFSNLYEKTTDRDVKKMLLNEAAEIGDRSELVFLAEITKTDDRDFVRLAKLAIEAINERFNALDAENTIANANTVAQPPNTQGIETESTIDFTELQNSAITDSKVPKNDISKDKLPLELIFLHNEFGIGEVEENHKKLGFLDFELSEEFFKENNLNQQ